MHRMMYRTYLDRVSESVFGAQKFEFCPNKGKKSGSRIAYSGTNAIDRMLRAVTRLLLVAEIERFEFNLMEAVTLQIIKENIRDPR